MQGKFDSGTVSIIPFQLRQQFINCQKNISLSMRKIISLYIWAFNQNIQFPNQLG